MITLIVTDINQTVNVRYLTDMIVADQQAFTIMDIQGLTDSDRTWGAFRNRDVKSLVDFQKMAQAAGFKVTATHQENGASTTSVICDFTNLYPNGGLGIDNI